MDITLLSSSIKIFEMEFYLFSSFKKNNGGGGGGGALIKG